MPPFTVLALSMSMSVDAFAVAVGRGTTLDRPRLSEAMRTGIVFGVVEAITPFIGWLFGLAANDWIADYDHWLAFTLLAAVGLHMMHGAMKDDTHSAASKSELSWSLLIITAVGTSLDAMAVGLSLALIDIDLLGILTLCGGVGITTFVFATLGMIVGKKIGDKFGSKAEVVAGLVLCSIGSFILYEHLAS